MEGASKGLPAVPDTIAELDLLKLPPPCAKSHVNVRQTVSGFRMGKLGEGELMDHQGRVLRCSCFWRTHCAVQRPSPTAHDQPPLPALSGTSPGSSLLFLAAIIVIGTPPS